MRRTIGVFALFGTGLLAIMPPSFAQTTQADIPANPTLPIPTGNSDGSSGLLLSVWSPALSLSLTYYTGLRYEQVQPDDITPDAGLVLDFGLVPEWNRLSQATDLVYHLIAVDPTGNAPNRGVVTTAEFGSAAFTGNNGDVTSITGSSAWQSFVGQLNGLCTSNPCVNTVDAGSSTWGARYGGFLDVSAAGNVGTALGFYRMVGGLPAPSATAPAIVTRFENSLGNFGTWLLTEQGQLTYSIAGGPVVPLPAAVWLLLSGLAGLGGMARVAARPSTAPLRRDPA